MIWARIEIARLVEIEFILRWSLVWSRVKITCLVKVEFVIRWCGYKWWVTVGVPIYAFRWGVGGLFVTGAWEARWVADVVVWLIIGLGCMLT